MRVLLLTVLTLGMLVVGQSSRGAQDDRSVLTYHDDPARSGRYIIPGLTWARAASAHLDQRFDAQFQGTSTRSHCTGSHPAPSGDS